MNQPLSQDAGSNDLHHETIQWTLGPMPGHVEGEEEKISSSPLCSVVQFYCISSHYLAEVSMT